ncbi:DUF397 domain-containing protein [Streptomyces hygroscopicus]|uniref:DUF397 domain-containing protein n=1 Tax=Streptomyces hygroscopicus TaxID=1912 RepID=UPI001F33618E|nr:DUF397 domain-containing protein [Streptomyces hygroscopicus]
MSILFETGWRKSSFSEEGGNNCIEIATGGGTIVMRESCHPETIVTTDRITLGMFVRAVKNGRFDHLAG